MKNKIKTFLLFSSLSFLSIKALASAKSGMGIRTVYTSTNVGTTNWFVIASSLPNTVSQISVADTSGQVMEVGICNASAPANSEVRQFLIPAGGTAVNLQITSSQRISIRAVSAPATNGENDFNILF
jgi:hypothetical protein